MDLGLSLKIALAKSKTSQAKLADDLGLKRQAVCRWATTGNMTKDTIELLANYFKMRPSEFISLGE